MASMLTIHQLQVFRRLTLASHIEEQLNLFGDCDISNPRVIKSWHDAMLFYCAYPPNRNIYQLANKELNRISAVVKNMYNKRQTGKIRSLNGSGIIHTSQVCQYTLLLTNWLLHRCTEHISLHDSAAETESISSILQILMPAIEFQTTTQNNLGLSKRIQFITGTKDPAMQLRWLLNLIMESSLPLTVREQLYDRLQVFISWRLEDPHFNRTYLREPRHPVFYHRELMRKADSTTIIRQPVAAALQLTKEEKQRIADVCKASLALYYRETDPFTYADKAQTEVFDMGRGLHIALIGMIKEKRLSLESYVGYMAFKNGIPVSYGGGWIFGNRCKIGVNIYPPFRGGESTWLFSQILRLYKQYFKISCFNVKPYQFGKGNAEGLKSAAFWFYYKLGFRPADSKIADLAEKEWKLISAGNKYHSSLSILKKFTSSDLQWKTTEEELWPDPAVISKKISASVATQFYNDRKNAMLVSNVTMLQKLEVPANMPTGFFESTAWQNWSLLLYFLPGISLWSNADKKSLLRIILLRYQGKEAAANKLLIGHTRLYHAIHHWLR